jgi:hypothetical protein
MQISQVSSNNVVVGSQPQTNTANSNSTQTTETNLRSNSPPSTDSVTISPEAQELSQQRLESDGNGSPDEATESSVPAPNAQANNGSASNTPSGFTGLDVFA